MAANIFEIFAKMISGLPPEAILRALDVECAMLEQDRENHRLDRLDDALSILDFRQFIRMVQEGAFMRSIKPLPPDHLEFYKETVVRLVQTGHLPASAMKQFDSMFVSNPGL
jgi:hypothetical protein